MRARGVAACALAAALAAAGPAAFAERSEGSAGGAPQAGTTAPGPAGSAGSSGEAVLTLEESLRLALEHSPRVAAAQSGLLQGEAQLDQARAGLRPSLTVGAEAGRGNIPRQLSGSSSTTTQATLSLSFRQAVGRSEAVRLQVDLAELSVRQARLREEASRVEVVAQVSQAYLGVLEALSGRDLAAVQLRNAREFLRVTLERRASGTATDADVLDARAAEGQARQALAVAGDAVRLAYEALYQVMGVPVPDTLPDLDRGVLAGGGAVGPGIGFDELRRRALQARPELLQARAAVEQARVQVRQAERADNPTLSLSATYQWPDSGQQATLAIDQDARLSLSAARTLTVAGDSSGGSPERWQVQLTLGWPFMDGGAARAAIQQAQEAVRQAELNVRALESSVALELSRRYTDLSTALQELSVADLAERETRARYEQVRSRAEVGAATRLEVWQAEGALVGAHHRRLQAAAGLVRARTQLAVTAGYPAGELMAMLTGAASSGTGPQSAGPGR